MGARLFTSDASWVPQNDSVANGETVTFRAVGKGGNGASGNFADSSGGGGGGGEYRSDTFIITDNTLAFSIFINEGSGGNARVESPDVVDIVLAVGGTDATSGTGGGAGGTGGTGAVGYAGGNGGDGQTGGDSGGGGGGGAGSSGAGSNGSGSTGGAAASMQFSAAGGAGGNGGVGVSGVAGSVYGGGGGGGGIDDGGGGGASGAAYVEWGATTTPTGWMPQISVLSNQQSPIVPASIPLDSSIMTIVSQAPTTATLLSNQIVQGGGFL